MDLSVVIPSKNRAFCLSRTLDSVFKQNINGQIEIIIVDDASTDNTNSLVKGFQRNSEIPIKYIKNQVSVGGAIARNQGAKIAKGKYIAFLDSDDEWLPHHLESKINILKEKNSDGVFSTYFSHNGKIKTERSFGKQQTRSNLASSIFSNEVDPRTSTFVFTKEKFDQVRFNEGLKKHQDWDLAIRFDGQFKLVMDTEPTVILHNNIHNRMSNSNNHKATNLFISEHSDLVDKSSMATFYFIMAVNTLRFEGKNSYFNMYLRKAKSNCKKKTSALYFKLFILSLPINTIKIYDLLKGKKKQR